MTFNKISMPKKTLQAISIPREILPCGIQYATTFIKVANIIK